MIQNLVRAVAKRALSNPEAVKKAAVLGTGALIGTDSARRLSQARLPSFAEAGDAVTDFLAEATLGQKEMDDVTPEQYMAQHPEINQSVSLGSGRTLPPPETMQDEDKKFLDTPTPFPIMPQAKTKLEGLSFLPEQKIEPETFPIEAPRLPTRLESPGVRLGQKGDNIIPMYIGPKSKGWSESDEGKFSSLTDKKERREISDKGAKYLYGLDAEGNSKKYGTVKDFLQHEELFKEYPYLQHIDTHIEINPLKRGVTGSYTPFQSRKSQGLFDFQKEINLEAESPEYAREGLLHELQHDIQENEGWARGGSPSEFAQERESALARVNFLNTELSALAKAIDSETDPNKKSKLQDTFDNYMNSKMMYKDAIVNLPRERYQKLAGEVEARDTQARKDLTLEQRRSKSPLFSQGIPLRDMIVKMQSKSPSFLEDKPTGEGREWENYFSNESFNAKEILKYPGYHEAFKNQTARIVFMTPDEYFEQSGKSRSKPQTADEEKRDIVESKMQPLRDAVKNGKILPMPYIDFVGNSQEGRHRAMLAKELGLKEIPVALIEPAKRKAWQIPLSEIHAGHVSHENAVRNALESGEKVPEEVLADYPNLLPSKSRKRPSFL